MNRSRKIWLAVFYAVNVPVAIVVWLILYQRGYVFHLAGVYFAPGILVLAGMLLVDILTFFLLSAKTK